MRVAVYGTLRKGQSNHSVLEDSPKVGELRQKLNYSMWDYNGWYPILTSSSKPSWLTLEVYSVNDRIFEALDFLEGYPVLYDRRLETIYGEDTYIYFMENLKGKQGATPIPSGDWVSYRESLLGYG